MPGTYSLAGRIIHQWLHEPLAQSTSGSGSGSSTGTGGGSSGAGLESGSETPESSGAGESKNAALLDRVADVQIGDGTFKYVLLRVSTPDGQTKVRAGDTKVNSSVPWCATADEQGSADTALGSPGCMLLQSYLARHHQARGTCPAET